MATYKYRSDDIKDANNLKNYPVDEIDWSDVCTNLSLTEEQIREYADYIDWSWLMNNYLTKINVNIIREFADRFVTTYVGNTWGVILSERIMGDRTLEEFLPHFKTFYFKISERQTYISEQFIERWSDILNWDTVLRKQKLSEEFIEKHLDKLYELNKRWSTLCTYQKLSEDFIAKYKNEVDWDMICKHQQLSEQFIVRFGHRCGIENICTYQTLSEEFIREWKEKLDWNAIVHHQKLSKEFVREFKSRMVKYNFKMAQAHLMTDNFKNEFTNWWPK